jgi:monothiol glutaredoxin
MSEHIFANIQAEIDASSIVLFMKGTPAAPQCGFSATVVQVLTYFNVPFKGINVLADPDLRDGIKKFSEWPTVPQLYVKGEFIGGCDIVREMAASGELAQLFTEKGIQPIA